jgi:poly-gamma-glutamate synthesis protein (capsule biosynthesis protein)
VGTAIVLAAGAVIIVRRLGIPKPQHDIPAIVIPDTGPVTVAVTGDALITRPLSAGDGDAGFTAVRDLIRHASLALTNLEVNLLGPEEADRARARPLPRWVFGSEREARELRRLGFGVVSQANNHATDYGAEGLAATSRVLDAAGLLHAGAGTDLAHARSPALAGGGARRVAVIAVTSSAKSESRATVSRPDIQGRPGVNALRYTADITADPATFATLKGSMLNAGPPSSETELTMFGTRVKRGDRTSVKLVADSRDQEEVLGQIREVRARADVVIVSVYSHEPTNSQDAPADFLRQFARDAIDAGASLVVGHGPHRLRGVEVFRHGAILYSLGNFLYQTEGLDFRAADAYDAGTDLFGLALGTAPATAAATSGPDQDAWWESAVAVATFEGGRLTRLRLHPIDLGAALPMAARGTPRAADRNRSEAILNRLTRLSQPYQTTIRVENLVGVVDLPAQVPTADR